MNTLKVKAHRNKGAHSTVHMHAYIVKILNFGFRAFFKKFGRFLVDST